LLQLHLANGHSTDKLKSKLSTVLAASGSEIFKSCVSIGKV